MISLNSVAISPIRWSQPSHRAQGVSSSPFHCKQLCLGWKFLLVERHSASVLLMGKSAKEVVFQHWDCSSLDTTKMTEKKPQETTEKQIKVKLTLKKKSTSHMSRGWEGVFNGCCHNPTSRSPLPHVSTGNCGQAPVSPGWPCPATPAEPPHTWQLTLPKRFLQHQSGAGQLQTRRRLSLACEFPGKACAARVQSRTHNVPLNPKYSGVPGNSHKHCCHHGWLPAETEWPPGVIPTWNSLFNRCEV